jgi:histidine triad (HIT) family protein
VHNHEPPGYACPFCRLVGGRDDEHNRQDDVVFRDEATTAFVSPKWWEKNAGHVLVVPNDHVENLYDISPGLLGAVYATAKRVAEAIRATYGCEGISTRQHNEPGGGQDVWHLHVHVFPRWAGDRLYERNAETRWASAEERAPFAARLRERIDEAGADT